MHAPDSPKGTGLSPHQVRLSPAEDMMCEIQEAFDGDSVSAVIARVRGCVEEEPLRTALSRLQLRHPKLRARIFKTDDGHRCYEVSTTPQPIPIEITDCETENLAWQAETYRAVSAKMNLATGPLARLHVLRNRSRGICDIILVMSHAISDAVCIFAGLHDLLEFYEEAEHGGMLPAVASLPLVVVSRAPVPESFLQRLAVIVRMVWNRRGGRRGNWVALPQSQQPPAAPLMDRTVLSEQENADLEQRCCEEGTTMSGILFAAGIFALTDIMPDQEMQLRCRVSIDIRRSLNGPAGPVNPHDLGCFISGYKKIMTVGRQQMIWDVGREIFDELIDFMKVGGPQILFNMARFANRKMFMKIPKRDTLMVIALKPSGIRSKYGSLMVEECSTFAKNDKLGPSLVVSGLTINNRLCVSVLGAGVPEEFWRRYQKAVHDRLRTVVTRPVAQDLPNLSIIG